MVTATANKYALKPEVKSLWIELLITTYKDCQGRGTLVYHPYGSSTPKYCALGVLCIAYALTHNLDPVEYMKTINHPSLPKEVIEWSGIYDTFGSYRDDNGEHNNIAFQNDIGYTFQELANIIQEHL